MAYSVTLQDRDWEPQSLYGPLCHIQSREQPSPDSHRNVGAEKTQFAEAGWGGQVGNDSRYGSGSVSLGFPTTFWFLES